ncbi:MAG: Asp-tRNA(Asn)/Glu-tRNA(Gln) amidotransferase subunit GatC [Candidatus Saccharibacteria bacterium]|nr:Asp-tRNA(Asn)/Glu-tRNA(Gln) amidotransferase subunit GatC [Candidatus Saccharibacteria bacterium]
MTTITQATVAQMAQLGGLELTDDEADRLASDIERTLSYIDQLAELDTTEVEPTYQVTGLSNVWREDVIDNTLPSRETLLACAGDNVTQAQIKVPKVL